MKKLTALILAVVLAYTAPATQAHADSLDDLFKVIVGAAIGAIVVSALMSDDAEIGMHVEFNEGGKRGYFQYVGDGDGRGRYQGRRCREYDIVYTDECGRPTGLVETRYECKNRWGEWVQAGPSEFHSTRRRHPHRPDIMTCGFNNEVEVIEEWPAEDFMVDEPWTDETLDNEPPPFIRLEEPQPPTIIPTEPPAMIPMEQPPGIIPMGNNPGFLFPATTQ